MNATKSKKKGQAPGSGGELAAQFYTGTLPPPPAPPPAPPQPKPKTPRELRDLYLAHRDPLRPLCHYTLRQYAPPELVKAWEAAAEKSGKISARLVRVTSEGGAANVIERVKQLEESVRALTKNMEDAGAVFFVYESTGRVAWDLHSARQSVSTAGTFLNRSYTDPDGFPVNGVGQIETEGAPGVLRTWAMQIRELAPVSADAQRLEDLEAEFVAAKAEQDKALQAMATW